MELVHCVYCSRSVDPLFGSRELEELLLQCRKNNLRSGVTGMLLFEKSSFFQILEGPDEAVGLLLDRISGDPRHECILKIIYEPINRRYFGNWSMGYPEVTLDQLSTLPGLNDFFVGEQTSFANLDRGRAKTLLEAFKSGSWRRSLSFW